MDLKFGPLEHCFDWFANYYMLLHVKNFSKLSIPRYLTWSENSGCTNTLFNKLHWSLNVSLFNISWDIWDLRLYLLRCCAFDDEDCDVVLDAVRVDTVSVEPATISVVTKLQSGVPTRSLSNVTVLLLWLALAVFVLRLYRPLLCLLKLERRPLSCRDDLPMLLKDHPDNVRKKHSH